MDNLQLWARVEKTNPAATRPFTKAGGFSGTAIDPMHLVKLATEVFGPSGIGWGFEEVEHTLAEGVWFSKVRLWYLLDGARGQVEQWGATTLVSRRKDGIFVDEEAAKKAITDGLTKCLSYLGFAADVHMGKFDDAKYVARLRREFEARPETTRGGEPANWPGAEGLPEIEGVVFERIEVDGHAYIAATGKTYGKGEVLKRARFRWHSERRTWLRAA